MASVTLDIGGNRWPVNCRDGEEDQLRKIGAMVDARWDQAQVAAGDAGAARVLLLIALMLADELADAQASAVPPTANVGLEQVAEYLEELAEALERGAASD